MLLSFSGNSQTLDCRDSLKLAIQHGKVLSKGVKQRDSLLVIKSGRIVLLEKKQKGAEQYGKKMRKQRNGVGFFVIILIGILIIV